LKNNILYDYKIEIIYKDLTKLKELITHELTHLKEFYEYCKKINSIEINNKTKIINNSNQIETINFSWIDLKNINNDIRKINTSKEYDKFLFLVYLSLDGEMNSRISQLYNYLYDFGIDDDKIMMNKIIEHQNYIYYLELKNFNHIHMCDKVIDEIGDELFIEITNKFTKKLLSYDILNRIKSLKNIPKNINTLEDTYSFFNIWEKLFTKKCEKHYNKFKHIIKEVSKDLKGLKPFNDAYRNDIDNDFRKW
jgi:hypothetical protein